jgi:hypothetical protein
MLKTLFQSNTIAEKRLIIKESIDAFVARVLRGRLRKMPNHVIRTAIIDEAHDGTK